MNHNEVLRPLPLRLRPQPSETAESYVHRLARTNHLRPSYLRRCLTTPEGSYGPIQLDKLAALTGRAPAALLHALPDLAPRPASGAERRSGRDPDDQQRRNQQRRRDQFAAIRRDARAGLSGRALERKHKVGHRTVSKALASATPPPRKKMNRQAAVLHNFHDHIDSMIHTNPAIPVSEVWARLVDDHGATASYGAIRAYVARHPHRRRPA
jgi:hypothetical protein